MDSLNRDPANQRDDRFPPKIRFLAHAVRRGHLLEVARWQGTTLIRHFYPVTDHSRACLKILQAGIEKKPIPF